MAKNMFAGASAPEAQAAAVPVGPRILVARKALPVGTIVDAESFAFQPWPSELLQNAYYKEGGPDADMTKLVGTVVRTAITAGQPLTRGSLVGPQDRGFLAAALGPGMRAVTMPISNTSAVAGFVFPGDRVDVVLTQEVQGGGDGPPLKVSETIVRNLRVLATDNRVESSKGEDGKPVVVPVSTVTLETTPRIAEKIAVAQTFGSMSLSLRPLADTTSELERMVASGQVKLPAGASAEEERKMMLAMASRPTDGGTYSTGGDVSRFQRRTIPARPAEAAKAAEAGKTVTTVTGATVPMGPTVRVARGNNVTYVPVGAR